MRDRAPAAGGRGDEGDRRAGEQGAALGVDPAEQHVHDLDQPAGQGAELLVAEADAAVDHGPLGGGELTGEAADAVGVDAAPLRHRLGRVAGGGGEHLVDAPHPALEVAEGDQPLLVEDLHDGQQQGGVGAGPHRHPLVGPVGGAGAAGVDHDRAAAPLADAVELTEQVGVGEDRALRRLGVGAHHHEEVGVGHVGDRDAPGPAVDLGAGQVLRPLVDGAGRPDGADAAQAGHRARVAAQRVAVDVRVAHVGVHRRDAVLGHDAVEQLLAAGEGLVPRDLAPLVAVAHHRRPQAVGVVVELAERRALGAEVALAPHVGAVAADAHDALALGLDLEAAHGLAQRAGSKVRRHRPQRTLARSGPDGATGQLRENRHVDRHHRGPQGPRRRRRRLLRQERPAGPGPAPARERSRGAARHVVGDGRARLAGPPRRRGARRLRLRPPRARGRGRAARPRAGPRPVPPHRDRQRRRRRGGHARAGGPPPARPGRRLDAGRHRLRRLARPSTAPPPRATAASCSAAASPSSCCSPPATTSWWSSAAPPGSSSSAAADTDRSRRSARSTLAGTPVEVIAGGRRALLDLGRVLIAAEATGIAHACTDQAAEYAKVREQFGRQIAMFQAVKHHCANMFVAAELSTAAVWDAARAAAAGGDQLTFAAASAATLAVRAAYDDAQLCIQVHGGIGFTWEHDAHLYLRRALALAAVADADVAAAEVVAQVRNGTRLRARRRAAARGRVDPRRGEGRGRRAEGPRRRGPHPQPGGLRLRRAPLARALRPRRRRHRAARDRGGVPGGRHQEALVLASPAG